MGWTYKRGRIRKIKITIKYMKETRNRKKTRDTVLIRVSRMVRDRALFFSDKEKRSLSKIVDQALLEYFIK